MKKTKIITIIFCLLLASGFGVYFLVDASRPIDAESDVSTSIASKENPNSTEEEKTRSSEYEEIREEMLSKWREEYSAEYPDEVIQDWLDSWLNYRRGLEDEDFYEIKKDLDIVVEFLEKLISQHPDEEYINLLYGGAISSAPAKASLSWLGDEVITLDLSKKEIESLVSIRNMFDRHDISFETLLIYDGFLTIYSMDGVYKLTYSFEGKEPPSLDMMGGINGTNYDIVRIEENWYHGFVIRD